MSIWNGLKSAFGFGGTGYEEGEFDSDIPAYTPKPIQPDYHSSRALPAGTTDTTESNAATQTPAEETAAAEESIDTEVTPETTTVEEKEATDSISDESAPMPLSDPELPADLFDAVIERFNSFQPDFVAKCLNVEAERKYLIESLDKSLRSRVAATTPDVTAEMESLRKRVATLEAQTRTNDELRQENRRLRLSVERQKRSLLDRINDLESQVARYYQEKESFFASRHTSLCTTTPGNTDENIAVEETPEAQTESAATSSTAITTTEANETPEHGTTAEIAAEVPVAISDTPELTAARAELEQLRISLTEAEAREAQLIAREATLTTQLQAQQEETAREATLREQLETKATMAEQMIIDLRNELAANRQEYEETYASQQQALELIQEQVENFEQIKERMESRISELKDALKKEKALNQELAGAPSVAEENTRLIEETSRVTRENSSLRHTIETNLYNQANSEMKLRAEIKELSARLAEQEKATATAVPVSTPSITLGADSDPIPSEASFAAIINATAAQAEEKPAVKRKRGRPKKAKIDEELDNTEWFASQKESADFGYHEPPRRPTNDDANQLSLF